MEIIRRFLRYCERFSPHTQRRYRDILFNFADDMPGCFRDICPEHIETWIAGQKQLNNNSKNAYLTAVKSLFSFSESLYDYTNVSKSVKYYRSLEPFQRVLSYKEISQILFCASDLERALILFLCHTGLRASELCKLQPSSVYDNYIIVQGKGNKKRTVPLNKTAKSCIPAIFSKSYTRNTLYNICRRLARQANITKKFGPHACRHYFCTELLRRGVPITKVSKIMGHASIAITERVYCHLTTPDYLGCTDCLD